MGRARYDATSSHKFACEFYEKRPDPLYWPAEFLSRLISCWEFCPVRIFIKTAHGLPTRMLDVFRVSGSDRYPCAILHVRVSSKVSFRFGIFRKRPVQTLGNVTCSRFWQCGACRFLISMFRRSTCLVFQLYISPPPCLNKRSVHFINASVHLWILIWTLNLAEWSFHMAQLQNVRWHFLQRRM